MKETLSQKGQDGPSLRFTVATFLERISQVKSIERSVAQSEGPRTMGWVQLLAYGIAATVGSGIYVVVGEIAHKLTGPSVLFSVLGAGLLALLTAFCYLELSGLIPASGSSYIYGYTILGEFVGFLLGWTSTLEYSFAGSVIAISIIEYVVGLVDSAGGTVPTWLYAIPEDPNTFLLTVNVLAGIFVLLVTLVVLGGIAFGAKINAGLTVLNISLLSLIIAIGAAYVSPGNYAPFMPFPGVNIFHGAAQMMFCYIGFDTICNLTGEAKKPSHLRVGVIGTVLSASLLYAAVGFVLTGMVPYADIMANSSLATAFQQVGVSWVSYVVRVCAILMMTATLLACLIGQPKLFQMMAKDGLLPPLFDRVNAKGIPVANIWLSSGLAALVACFIKKTDIVDLTALGALCAFSVNAAGLLLFKFKRAALCASFGPPLVAALLVGSLLTFFLFYADLMVAFAIFLVLGTILPAVGIIFLCYLKRKELSSPGSSIHWTLLPWIPVCSIIGNACVIPTLPPEIFIQFAVWLGLGALVYFSYGYRNSHLSLERNRAHLEDAIALKSSPQV